MKSLSLVECPLSDLLGNSDRRQNMEKAFRGEAQQAPFTVDDAFWSQDKPPATIFLYDAQLLLRFLKMTTEAQRGFFLGARTVMRSQKTKILDVVVEWGPQSTRRIRVENVDIERDGPGDGDLRLTLI
jgi:hypothetical protein